MTRVQANRKNGNRNAWNTLWNRRRSENVRDLLLLPYTYYRKAIKHRCLSIKRLHANRVRPFQFVDVSKNLPKKTYVEHRVVRIIENGRTVCEKKRFFFFETKYENGQLTRLDYIYVYIDNRSTFRQSYNYLNFDLIYVLLIK